ncbi:TetR/AcrR family transcriptional regulator [Chitinophaga sp. GCM10012297]|uniref:TetR/AcrR family transcriptional regulator n=1 Tax=Chitinophaga chungangae TaxID=2821488 RepID=A0ABS3YML8_9BACT|nr:TetR/AcrR family transcriptional regulator [Chitinophaga chungangae]MBO9155319.1 TetR/AcrR family transcriptional regulator [Chitinophaga chungangae]
MTETKDKIVSLADKLIRVKGFNAFSYKDISEPLQVKNAAIHYHFPTKSELGLEVVEKEMRTLAENTAKWKKLPEDEQLSKFCGVFRKHCNQGNVCLMGSLAPDYETLSPEMQEKVQQMASAILSWMTHCLEQGRKHKRFRFKGDAGDRALLVISNLQSSLLLSRVLGPSAFSRISRRLLEDLGA